MKNKNKKCGVSTINTDKNTMKIHIFFKLFFVILIYGVTWINTAQCQEFSISGNYNNSIFAGGISFDGTNFLVGLSGDATSDSSLTVQFISTTGQLVGNRILLGETGSAPLVAFDGTNYLLVWSDRYVAFLDHGEDAGLTNIYGRFINPSGSFVGNKFTIASNAYIKGCSVGNIHFNNTNYFFIYREDDGHGNIGPVYGQFISTSGSLLGSPIQISNGSVGDVAMAFDGTNYLVVFVVDSKYIYGQFISATGNLVGTNFPIDNSVNESSNPVFVAFDGAKYMVTFHDRPSTYIDSLWYLFARFVSTSGSVDANKITICDDSTQEPIIPSLAFDGTNYLSAWISMTSRQIKGRFLDTTGIQVNNEFVIFDSIAEVLPLGGVISYSGNKFVAVCTRINFAKSDYTNLGVYGKFLESLSINENANDNYVIKIYPNPANDIIAFDINSNENMICFIYNIIGALVKSENLKQNQQVNVGDLDNGIYIVEIKSKEWTSKQKLIIKR